jgi:hypothetical protein
MSSKKDKVKKEKMHLNKKELKNILRLLNKLPDNTRFKIKSVATGIGSKITVKIDGSEEEFDVSDYGSW